jgi:hypothetical protein
MPTGNGSGQLGNGTTANVGDFYQASPVLKAANTPLAGAIALAEADPTQTTQACAIVTGGGVYCWGDTAWMINGGTPQTSTYATPVLAADNVTPFTGVVQMAMNDTYACAIVQGAAANEVWCWGKNAHGQLATGDSSNHRNPTRVQANVVNPSKVVTFGSDENEAATCILDGGNVKCWGSNADGQVGAGNMTSPVYSPTTVASSGGTTPLSGVIDIAGGWISKTSAQACALLTDQTAVCWGEGVTSPAPLAVPTAIAFLGELDNDYRRYVAVDGKYHVSTRTQSVDCDPLP